MSFQNHTEIVINNVEIFVIARAKLYLPIRRKRLIKNKSDIFQYIARSLLTGLFLFLIDHNDNVIGIPIRKIIES